jgi:hypothetical protein
MTRFIDGVDGLKAVHAIFLFSPLFNFLLALFHYQSMRSLGEGVIYFPRIIRN